MALDYRRGVENSVWQKLWHFSELCDSYPSRNFTVRHDRPSDDELCSRCYSRARDAHAAY
jgi:hypothetical protein